MRLVTTEAGDPGPLIRQVDGHCGSRRGARAQTLRVGGTYQRSLGNLAEATALLSEGRDVAAEIGDQDLADEIQLTLSGTLARAGDLGGARQLMAEVADRRSDVVGDKARAQIGAMDSFEGEYAAGVEILTGLGERLEEAGELDWAARSWANEGWCLIQVGRSGEAVGKLIQCRAMWLSLGAEEAAGRATNHLAVAYSLLGRPFEALNALRRSWEGRELKMDDWLDAADLYLQAGLVDDALINGKAARASASTIRERGLCDLALARLYVTTGNYEKAVETATAATEAFGELGSDDLRFVVIQGWRPGGNTCKEKRPARTGRPMASQLLRRASRTAAPIRREAPTPTDPRSGRRRSPVRSG